MEPVTRPKEELDVPESEAVEEEENELDKEVKDMEDPQRSASHMSTCVELPTQISQPQKTHSHLLSSGGHLVVDEAFTVSFQEQCNSVLLTPKEIVLLLDALECDVPQTVLNNTDDLSATVPPIELPVLHAGPLAAVLSTYARNYSLVRDARSFTLAEDKSRLAVKRLCGLISGPWSNGLPAPVEDPFDTIREELLRSAHGSHGKTARPLYWSTRQVTSLLHIVGFRGPFFDGLTGHDFLTLDASTDLQEKASRSPFYVSASVCTNSSCNF